MVVLLVGILIWAVLVFQTMEKHSGGYCEDSCFEAKPVELTIQGIAALVGAAAAIGLATRCVRYALGRDPADMRMIRRAIVLLVSLVAWIVLVEAMGISVLIPTSTVPARH